MGSTVEEAVRAKVHAEKLYCEKNFVGAKNYALKAQMLCPDLEGISQMVATFGVYMAAEAKLNGELDYYLILGLDPSSERSKLKKQYKKLAGLLHPDKNQTVGADGAFRLVSEAWTILSDAAKRSSYDHRRNYFARYNAGAVGCDNYSKLSSSHSRLDTFWTVCTSCHVQYEYLRKYVNKRLSCKNCRGVFVAVETGLSPVNGSFPYNTNYSYMPDNGYGSHGYGMTSVSSTAGYCPPNGTSGRHGGYRPEYSSSTISFQGSCSSGNSVSFADPNGLSNSFVFYESGKRKTHDKDHSVKAAAHLGSNGYSYTDQSEAAKSKRGRPAKKRKVESTHEELPPDIVVEFKITHGNVTPYPSPKLSSQSDTLASRSPVPPSVDIRQLLINKARSEIIPKLDGMRLASEAAAAAAEAKKKVLAKQLELKRAMSMSMIVPNSDFHDFDKDRAEECFYPKQIWALYDEEDGMPRLYCLIRSIISVKPFKIYISYLSARTDTEFGSVNWLDSGFTKSCGNFRVFHSETIEQVNIFSHVLSRERAGRGGCVRIYPRGGDIWAMYEKWSPDWNRSTPSEVRHQYEMVEVLDEYSEENGGVHVAPLVQVEGFKMVYQRNRNKDVIRWIPRREMVRFSHQVPSCSLKPGNTMNLPEGCWFLDPAATPPALPQLQLQLQLERD
ncbi:uncharacterized protein LOC127253728 [Andrographis paniculata]|uniref:uncharacterized protein LOC127253728 n=1 Tax=Andrographis paniculata TaxID=175694 RepID=UPI0021E99AB0|nr:uncharacterized protein LOC127253728 [Andrographis paniculata]XP_051134413.1 uncharacterized protein LOC127253728 [Andrographis paniculata]XP_051134414.1 uncharacterized protein LOC127253728 [Andrographis paniculata]XP_051134416.1 uncharacterized protein LOC127253728 [Andrographis paniculata]